MKFTKRYLLIVLLVFIVLPIAVTGCETEESKNNEEQTPDNTSSFSPMKPQDSSVLERAVKWAQSTYSDIVNYGSFDKKKYDNYLKEQQDSYNRLNTARSSDFKAANNLYKSGDYAAAQKAYLNILSLGAFPLHLGARNNLVLAYANNGDYEESLRQAILLGLIHPDYKGNWVNILIPLYALGFDNASYSGVFRNTKYPPDSSLVTNMIIGDSKRWDEFNYAYAYNRVYSDMEASYNPNELSDKMSEFKGILEKLRQRDPAAKDTAQLIEYFESLSKIRNN